MFNKDVTSFNLKIFPCCWSYDRVVFKSRDGDVMINNQKIGTLHQPNSKDIQDFIFIPSKLSNISIYYSKYIFCRIYINLSSFLTWYSSYYNIYSLFFIYNRKFKFTGLKTGRNNSSDLVWSNIVFRHILILEKILH